MKKITTFNELIEYAYKKYKTRIYFKTKKIYLKKINYFDLKYDIHSLIRIIKSKKLQGNIVIFSENRYEYLVTLLANIIIDNKVIVIDKNLNSDIIRNLIKKHKINTIYFSDKNTKLIEEILEINKVEKSKENIKTNINLINFDFSNNPNIEKYEKLINMGRYLENYSIEEINNYNNTNIIIANQRGEKEYKVQNILDIAMKIISKIKIIKRNKINIEENEYIDSFYKIIFKIIIPILYGFNIKYNENNIELDKKIEKNNIEIINETKDTCILLYRKNNYIIKNINEEIYIDKIKANRNLLKIDNKMRSPNFILIKNTNKEKVKKGAFI